MIKNIKNDKLKEVIESIINYDYYVDFEDNEIMSVYGDYQNDYDLKAIIKHKSNKGRNKFVTNDSIEYNFENAENNSLVLVKSNNLDSLLNIENIFQTNFNVLNIMQNIYHDYNFIKKFIYGTGLSKELYPTKIEDLFNRNSEHLFFKLNSKGNPQDYIMSIEIRCLIDLDTYTIKPLINMYFRDPNILLTGSYLLNEINEFKVSLLSKAANLLNKDIKDLKISDHSLLTMLNI